MSDMRWTFEDIYKNVSENLGLGSSPTGDNLTKVKNIVYRGYMKFLTSVNPKTRKVHQWSFLKKNGILRTSTGVYRYLMPDDFWMLVEPVNFSTDDGYGPLTKVSIDVIKKYRAYSEYQSVPEYIAVGAGDYSKFKKQREEAWLFPTADQEYFFQYRYLFMPEKPTATTDYFVGGPEVSEGIRLCAISVGEQEEDDVQGTLTGRAAEFVTSLMLADMEAGVPDTVGRMRNGAGIERTLDNTYRRSITDLSGTVYDNDGGLAI